MIGQTVARYLQGEAYLAAKQGVASEMEFPKILDHPAWSRSRSKPERNTQS
jgi:hypothetical protein